jgi:hypothetical protein
MKKIEILLRYIEQFDTILLFIMFYKVLEVVIVLLSILIFGLFYWKNFKQINFNGYRFLPVKNKVLLILFTLFFAVPNKVLINNRIPAIITAITVFLIVAVSSFFPLFILVYVNFWVTVLESYFFAVFYEENLTFTNFVNKTLFKNDAMFAEEYFSYFWGNMSLGGGGKGRAGAVGSAVGALYKIAREHEKTLVRDRSKEEAARYIASAQEKPKTAREAFELQKEIEEHVLKRDTTILNGERFVINSFDKVQKWFQDLS